MRVTPDPDTPRIVTCALCGTKTLAHWRNGPSHTCEAHAEKWITSCGTRAVVQRRMRDFRVVCATCHGGGWIRHESKGDAIRIAIRDSNRPCSCGAR